MAALMPSQELIIAILMVHERIMAFKLEFFCVLSYNES